MACSTTKTTTSEKANEFQKTKAIVPLVGAINVNRFQFENGLRLLVIEDHSSPTFAYQTWYRVGSRDEVPGRTGLAHLFEHMMFKETKNMKEGEFDKLLERAGAEGENAFTSRDYTAYIQEMPKDKLQLITKAEADRMVNLVINQKAFKTETEVVQNERRFRNENNPDGLMDQKLFELAFKKHPYRWPVIGYQQDLNQMTSADAAEFYKAYYSPNHATIIVVGDVVAEEVRSLVEEYYGNLAMAASPPHLIPEEPRQTAPRKETLRLNIQVEKLLLGYHIPQVTHSDTPALDVLQSVLTGGKSSRLNRALVDTGIATSVESYGFDDKDPSLLVIMANLQKGKRAGQAEKVILSELAKLAKAPVSDQELARAKNKINFGFYSGLSSNFEKSYFLGHYESIAGDFTIGIRHQEEIQKITARELKDVAKKYLQPKARSVIIGVKK